MRQIIDILFQGQLIGALDSVQEKLGFEFHLCMARALYLCFHINGGLATTWIKQFVRTSTKNSTKHTYLWDVGTVGPTHQLSGQRDPLYCCHAYFHINYGGYPDFRRDRFWPLVSILTTSSVVPFTDVRRFLLSYLLMNLDGGLHEVYVMTNTASATPSSPGYCCRMVCAPCDTLLWLLLW